MDAQTRLEIQNLTEQQQQYVIQTLPVKEKSLSSAYIFWVLFGAHYFYLNKPFECNREIAKQVIHDAILLYPKPQKLHSETIDAEYKAS